MSQVPIAPALQIAMQHHQAGRLAEAEPLYRGILLQHPDHHQVLHLLGVLACQVNRYDEAMQLIRHAIALNPDNAQAHYDLGAACERTGEPDGAIICYRRAIALQPDHPQAHNNLGAMLQNTGQLDDAIACYRRAIALKPDYAHAHYNLGAACERKGDLDEALGCYQRAIALNPNHAQAVNNFGVILQGRGQLDEAIACYRRAIALKPDYSQAHYNLGAAYESTGRLDDAGNCYQRAISLDPMHSQAHVNLANVLKDTGRLDEAISFYEKARAINPGSAIVHSNLIYAMYFHRGQDIQGIREECRRWNLQHAQPLRQFIPPHNNDPNPERPLKIGYVSPDFRDHCLALFMAPLLRCHDPQRFHTICYADVSRPDRVTHQLQSLAGQWRNIAGLSDLAAAEMIHNDQIDILVDLTMHMGRNRLPLFARKPAPVQVCWLAYPDRTGLETIDYRMTDPYLEPAASDDSLSAEQPITLPDSFWCYDPLTSEPKVNALPALQNGFVTFGCLNNFCKVNDPLLHLWAKVLMAVTNSRFILLSPRGSHRQRTAQVLADQGIDPDRVEFATPRPRPQYLELYRRIDLALDSFPVNGHTTSLDALWMGVPVITLVGPTSMGRAGLCQLTNLGLTQLIAHRPEPFMAIAVKLANDLPALSELRATLRRRMQSSPLMDAPRFARNMEAAYRTMWQRWCAKN